MISKRRYDCTLINIRFNRWQLLLYIYWKSHFLILHHYQMTILKKDRNDLKDLVENVIIKWIIDKANQYFRQTYVIVSYYGNKDLAEILVLFCA